LCARSWGDWDSEIRKVAITLSNELSLKNRVRKVAVKLGVKQQLMPAYEFMNRRKAQSRMKLYDPSSTLYGLNTEKRDFDITVSFTTYPTRIKSAIYVADAMLRQTLKPDRVILVLAEDEYSSKYDLPEDYKQLEKRGLSIIFVENLKPHNKYQYAMKNYPNSIVITVDDDILYDDNLIETLFNSHRKHPKAVSAMRAHRILFSDKKVLSYNDWGFESTYTDMPAFDLIATGVGGVLYPPQFLMAKHEMLFNISAIRENSLLNDDIWLKLLELQCDVPVVLAKHSPPDILLVPSSQKTSLQSSNVDSERNDKIMRDTMRYLEITGDDLYERLSGHN